ncbi:MAG: DUF547 domain-containing protein [Gammaproteobacteria bacterium]|nr:DUF547 domain-containing protein [Gammaproteobacteria bacterium]
MTHYTARTILFFFGFFALYGTAGAAESTVPEPFQGFDADSKYAINYDDLTAVLKTVVIDMGISTRRVAQEGPEVTGTRMKNKVKKTANEGNRFYFETFKDDEEAQQFLRDIQKSLEQLPSEAPLRHFSREEQLAYWLNLYNVTVLNEVIAVYPAKNLKKITVGKKSIFDKKLLTVAGVPLSLNDIQFTILKQNYDNNPLVIYGLYQGIIGGPSIRKRAYTGADVMSALENNAYEFINSNRGTWGRDKGVFRVSSFYDRNRAFFPNFEADLAAHLEKHLTGTELTKLQAGLKLKANIDDWSVTDLMGTHQRIGGSFATSRAALLDSVRSTVPMNSGTPTDGATLGASAGYGSATMASKGAHLQRIDPGLLAVLKEIDDKRNAENQRNAAVTVEDLEDSDEDEDQ